MYITKAMFITRGIITKYLGNYIKSRVSKEKLFSGLNYIQVTKNWFPVNLSFAEFNTPVSTSLTKFNVCGKVTTVKGPWRTLIMVANPGITKPVSRSQFGRNIGSADCFYILSHIPYVFIVREENEIHIVNKHCMLSTIKVYVCC